MNASSAIPLCVDMDGTLLRTDTLDESLLALCKQSPASLLMLPLWLARGRAPFKREIAQRTWIDCTALPRQDSFLAWLREQKAQGRRLILVTAADRQIAEAVAASHGDLFERVIASEGAINLSGGAKRARLVDEFGERGYDYAGNSAQDLAVWRSARSAVVVGSAALAAQAQALCVVEAHFAPPSSSLATWIKALRLHQWLKNLLLFVPMLLAHRFTEPSLVTDVMAAFLAFGLCASSVYVLNDLLDLDADRAHPRKQRRAFASGQLSARAGLLVAAVLFVAGFALAWCLSLGFLAVLGFYYGCTLAYSFWLKRVPVVDVLLLSGLYTLRLIAGSAAAGVMLSFWLLAFGIFLFLSLALIKRCTEMAQVRQSGESVAAGRGYHADDLPLLRNLGVCAGYGAVLVLALYVNSPESRALYHHPNRLWLLCPLLLYWVMRLWMKTHRGQMHDDPIVFALRDRGSYAVAVLMFCTVLAAS